MDVALKVWRYDGETGDRRLVDYEVEAPEWATLLDVLDLIKDKVDGTLAYRKSCRMMICGSCGMRMDGAAVLACKTRMATSRGGPRAGDLADGEPAVVKDLVVDMGPFWAKMRAMEPWLQSATTSPTRGASPRLAGADERHPQGGALHQLRLLRLGVQLDGVRSRVPRAAALAKGMRFVGDARDAASVERLERYNSEHGIWDCTRCYFCKSAARRASTRATRSRSSAPSRSGSGSTATWARSTRSGSSTRRRRPGGCAKRSSSRRRRATSRRPKQIKFALSLMKRGKARPLPIPHTAEAVDEARALYDVVKEQGRDGALGIVQGEHALARIEFTRRAARGAPLRRSSRASSRRPPEG
jgi:succinate dehydrogenase/fumarate reductase-like Fe-S protein